jgi:OmpA-OmpF porin, OOP family
MKKYFFVASAMMLIGALSGWARADSNGDQPETPAVMKTSYTVNAPMSEMDANGAPKLTVEFKTNRWDILPAFKSNVDGFGKYLADHPTSTAEITAYADHTGHGPANVTLAQKRADAVASYLISTYALSADRVKAIGQGEVSDKTHNVTTASRQLNRIAYGTITQPKP